MTRTFGSQHWIGSRVHIALNQTCSHTAHIHFIRWTQHAPNKYIYKYFNCLLKNWWKKERLTRKHEWKNWIEFTENAGCRNANEFARYGSFFLCVWNFPIKSSIQFFCRDLNWKWIYFSRASCQFFRVFRIFLWLSKKEIFRMFTNSIFIASSEKRMFYFWNNISIHERRMRLFHETS